MTYTSIFLCNKNAIRKKNLPKPIVNLSKGLIFPEYKSLWMFISKLGKQIDWGSSYIPVTKNEAIALVKGFIGNKKRIINQIEKIDDDVNLGMVCEEM